VIGVAAVEGDGFFVTDEPSDGIGDSIDVAQSGAGCPPRNSMEAHEAVEAARPQEVAESPFLWAADRMRLLQIGDVCRKVACGVAPARHTEG